MIQLKQRLSAIGWRSVLLGVLVYVVLGQVVQYIPNPMVPDAIIALNMTVVVILAYFTGPWEGALVGALGTLGNFLVKSALNGVDWYELTAVVPHMLMGVFAGYLANRAERQRVAVATTIFIGHGLNVLAFLIFGLLSLSRVTAPEFWNGLLAEGIIDMILILIVVSSIENVRDKQVRMAINWHYIKQNRVMLTTITVLTIMLVWFYVGGVWIAAYLFTVPLLLTSLTLGPIESWAMALILSAPLAVQVITQTTPESMNSQQQALALILTLNIVALTVGELANVIKHQQQMSQQQADELQKAYFVLKEADRLKAEMIQNISHELRTPLSLIVGYAELLATGMLDRLTPEQRRAAETIYTHGRQLAYLVEQITILHQVEQGQLSLQPNSLVNLARTCVEKRRVWAAGHKCPLQFSVRDDIPLMEMDAEFIGRAIDALIDNAVKFSPDGGEVEVALWLEKDRAYLAVRDHGIGIAPQDHHRLFQRFVQLDGSTTRRFGGMGTGLALVKEVVRGHHGDVWFESTPGQGSVFGFWLPLRPTRLEDLLNPAQPSGEL